MIFSENRFSLFPDHARKFRTCEGPGNPVYGSFINLP
jgi:hypothetical protein